MNAHKENYKKTNSLLTNKNLCVNIIIKHVAVSVFYL